MKYKILLMADCAKEGLVTFIEGLNHVSECYVDCFCSRKGGHKNLMDNLIRYIDYFMLPIRCLSIRKDYDYILGWQQFHVIIMAFYCRLFRLKKYNGKWVAVNFTYKRKRGILGSIYYHFMKYACDNEYIDYFHVPSNRYVERMKVEIGIPESKFIVAGFGIDDVRDKYINRHTQLPPFCLSIGRSNRDFDWLVNVWKEDCLKTRVLVILSDVWKPKIPLPENILYCNNIVGESQYAYFNDAELCISPILDGCICSGDTVLLTSMMFEKPVVVTEPSTLAEMYVYNGENGIVIKKQNVRLAAEQIAELLASPDRMRSLGRNARKDFMNNYSRRCLGSKIMNHLNGK